MTRKVRPHKATTKWWEKTEYKIAKEAVDIQVPKRLASIKRAVQEMSHSSSGEWKRKQCLDHNEKVIGDQLEGIQAKLNYIEQMLKKHKHVDDWKKWRELKSLVKTDWNGYIEGVPSRMLPALREKLPSFGLKSSTTRAVDDASRSHKSLPGQATVNDKEVHPGPSSTRDGDVGALETDNEDDSFGGFSDVPDPPAEMQVGDDGDVSESDESTSKPSSTHFPATEHLATSPKLRVRPHHADSPSTECHRESVPSDPVSLERAASPLKRKRKKSTATALQPVAALSSPSPERSDPVSPALPKRKRKKSTATALQPVAALSSPSPERSDPVSPALPKRKRKKSTATALQTVAALSSPSPERSDPVSPALPKRKRKKSTATALQTVAALSSPSPERSDPVSPALPKRKRKKSTATALQPVAALSSPSPERPKSMLPLSSRGVKHNEAIAPVDQPIDQGSEELGDSDNCSSQQTSPKTARQPRAGNSSPSDGPGLQSNPYQDTPCPSTRTRNSSGDRPTIQQQPAARASTPPDHDVPHKAMTREDLDLTIRLIQLHKVNLADCADDPDWFETWPLRHAFSNQNLALIRDSLLRGDFVPCPLLMCDAGIVDLGSLTLSDAIQQHVMQKSSDMKRKGPQYLKRHIRHLNLAPLGHDCSHKCHNFWYQLWLHLCAELHHVNVDRENLECHPRVRRESDGDPLLECLRHPDEPCLPGCCSLSDLAQVVYQWMAAKGFAHFGQIPLDDLEGIQDLPNHILQEPLFTYFITDDKPFEGADNVFYVTIGAEHRLGDLAPKQPSVPQLTPRRTTRPRGEQQRQAKERHTRFLKLKADTVKALNLKQAHKKNPPSNQQELAREEEFILGIQKQSLEDFYESPTGQQVLQENQQWVSWRDSKLRCTLCHTMWYDRTPFLDRRPNGKTDGTFSRGTIKFLDHFFGHIEHHESIRCEAFLRFLDDVPQFADQHGGFSELVDMCRIDTVPDALFFKRFRAPRTS